MKKYKDFIINTKDILSHINEAAYPGNIGMMEMMKFFNMWNDVVETLYTENKMWISFGTYVVHDEFLLAPIFDVLGIHPQKKEIGI